MVEVVLYRKEVRQVAWNNWDKQEEPEVGKRMVAVILTGALLGFLFPFVYVFFLAPVH